MNAVKLALLEYYKHYQMKAIHFHTTALSYLVKMGEPKTSI